MDARASKLRRLEGLRRNNPQITASALSEVIQDIELNGLPDLHSRKHVAEARDHTVKGYNAYGPMLSTTNVVCKDGAEKPLLFVNFLTMLHAAYQQGGGLQELVARTLTQHPCTAQKPWRIIYYSDEVVPGNVLSADVSRKVQCIYISFMEFGPVALSKEEAWFCIMACRSSFVGELESGMSQVTQVILNCILRPDSCNPKEAGFLLKDQGGCTIRMFYTLGAFLQDGSAHKYIFNLKGDAGTKFCIFCRNLVTSKSGLLQEDGSNTLVADEWDLTRIQQSTDQDIAETISRLEEKKATLNKGDFALWQQAVGFNYSIHGLLHCRSLSQDVLPISQFIHDWMHCFLVTGIFQTIMHLLLVELDGMFGNVYPTIEQCLRTWVLPKSMTTPLASLFSKKRQVANAKANTFKCTASEAIGLLGVFGYFLMQIVIPNAEQSTKDKCQVFFALADIIDLIQLVPKGKITPAMVDRAVTTFLSLCISCGFKENMHTKFHWCLHFGTHLQKHGQLPSCFVQERKHKVVKRCLAISRKCLVFTVLVQCSTNVIIIHHRFH